MVLFPALSKRCTINLLTREREREREYSLLIKDTGSCKLLTNFILKLQSNALRVITPATLDILLQILSSSELSGPTNEQRLDLLELKDLSLKCIVCMVHMIHGSSPDQVPEQPGDLL